MMSAPHLEEVDNTSDDVNADEDNGIPHFMGDEVEDDDEDD
jgi:hypothetical protein